MCCACATYHTNHQTNPLSPPPYPATLLEEALDPASSSSVGHIIHDTVGTEQPPKQALASVTEVTI